jgi:hypothetical protein
VSPIELAALRKLDVGGLRSLLETNGYRAVVHIIRELAGGEPLADHEDESRLAPKMTDAEKREAIDHWADRMGKR